MRELLIAGCLTLLLPVGTQAQVDLDSPAPASASERVRGLSDVMVESQGPFAAPPPNTRTRCCNLKGALIGAGIGAGLATVLTRSLCDAGDCTADYIKGALVLGGIGAGLGALVHPSRRWSMPSRRESTLYISPVISGRARGVMVAARF